MLKPLQTICDFDRKSLFQCITGAIIEGVFTALPYVWLAFIVQELTQSQVNIHWILSLLSLILLTLVVKFFVARLNINGSTAMAYASCADLRVKVAQHLLQVPMGFFSRHSVSDINYRMNKDIGFTETIFSHLFSQLITAVFIVITLSFLLFFLDWRLALCLFIGMPIAVIAQKRLKQGVNELSAAMHEETNRTNAAVADWVQGIREHKLSGEGHKHIGQLEDQIRHAQKFSLKHELRVGLAPIVSSLLPEVSYGLFLFVGVYGYFKGEVALASLVIFVIASVRLYAALAQLATILAESRFMNEAVVRVAELLSHKVMKVGNSSRSVNGSVSIKQASFSYDATYSTPEKGGVELGSHQHYTLSNINLTIAPRSLTAIVGSSGAGKTTLLHLLARYYPLTQGEIVLDNQSINSFSDTGLYGQVAMVSQDIQLFDATIMENLMMSREGLSEQDVIEACKKSYCHDFIRLMPQGYDSDIGEAGKYLSGGEKQRLSLARALLTDAKIILLDEITSALDVKNESLILQLLDDLKKEKTLIMISHRESLVVNADKIIMLNKGRQEATGTHNALLKDCPDYRALWAA